MPVFGTHNRDFVPDPARLHQVHIGELTTCVRSLFDSGVQCDTAHALTTYNIAACVCLGVITAVSMGLGGLSVVAMLQDDSSGGESVALATAKDKLAAKRRELDVLQAEVDLLQTGLDGPDANLGTEVEGRGMHA